MRAEKGTRRGPQNNSTTMALHHPANALKRQCDTSIKSSFDEHMWLNKTTSWVPPMFGWSNQKRSIPLRYFAMLSIINITELTSEPTCQNDNQFSYSQNATMITTLRTDCRAMIGQPHPTRLSRLTHEATSQPILRNYCKAPLCVAGVLNPL